MEATNTSAGLSEVARKKTNPKYPKNVTFFSKLSGRIVKVVVGREKHHCLVHEAVLSSVSDFFLKALSGPFRESDGVLELPEDKPAVFEIFLKWLYLTASGGDNIDSMLPVWLGDEFMLSLEVYVFADKYVINEFKEVIFSTVLIRLSNDIEGDEWLNREVDIRSHLPMPPKAKYLHYVFENTTESDEMRRLLCEHLAASILGGKLRDNKARKGFDDVGKAHAEFASFLLKAIVKWEKCMSYQFRSENDEELEFIRWYRDEESDENGMGEENKRDLEDTDESDSSSNSD